MTESEIQAYEQWLAKRQQAFPPYKPEPLSKAELEGMRGSTEIETFFREQKKLGKPVTLD